MRLVLASASPARLSVLRAAGVEPVVRVSGVDEAAVTDNLHATTHATVVTALAAAKAEAVAAALGTDHGDAVIVGCDSMLSFGGKLVGKPGDAATATRRWYAMAGGSGELLTGHAVLRREAEQVAARACGTDATTVRFACPDERELAAYMATDEPLGVAGAFTLDGLGGWFVEGVSGSPSSVIGISLPLTRRLLAEVGVSVVDLWSAA